MLTIKDVIDLRSNGWKPRNKQAGVMTIAEIHQQAAREQAEKAIAAQRDSISRGGSRAGHARLQPGEWQSVVATPRPLQRPADFSNLGRNFSSSGMSSAPTFGPQGHFASKRKPGVPGAATPPLSRQPSTTNINKFGILSGDAEAAAAAASVTAAPSIAEAAIDMSSQRKKLHLAPRTKPLPDPDDNGDHGSASDDNGEEHITPSTEDMEMTEHAAKIKIASDMKELWGEKDQGGSRKPEDIVEYFRALPEGRRSLLAERLVDDVFRISKIKDAETVAMGWR